MHKCTRCRGHLPHAAGSVGHVRYDVALLLLIALVVGVALLLFGVQVDWP